MLELISILDEELQGDTRTRVTSRITSLLSSYKLNLKPLKADKDTISLKSKVPALVKEKKPATKRGSKKTKDKEQENLV
jgi:hypothetical protein